MDNLHSDEMFQLPQDKNIAKVSHPQEQSFSYKLDCLKLEIDLIDRTISRLETYSQNIKNFTIVVWAGSVALLAGQAELREYVIFTAILPVLFWFMDAWWLRYVKGPFTRSEKITEFLNSDKLLESFEKQEFIDFAVLDVMGKQ